MIILIPVENLQYLFPDFKGDKESLIDELKNYYTVGSIKPDVQFQEKMVQISLDIENFDLEKRKFDKLLKMCESSEFTQAEALAQSLVQEYPTVSEYHRILGQVQSELGDNDKAKDTLIDALRWDPENVWALLMMGNIFAKAKDSETALLYYNQVLALKPNDNITLNNIGAQLMEAGSTDEAKNYFLKAVNADPDYPNSYLALGLLDFKEENYNKSFNYALQSAARCNKKNQVHQNSLGLALDSAKNIFENFDSDKLINSFIQELTVRTDISIKVIEDPSIPTAAKIEYAENYNRDYHLVKYKPNYPAVSHLILHELTHLELAEEARENDEYELFTTNQTHNTKFFQAYTKDAVKLRKKGVPENSVNNYLSAMFEGINSQIFNTPIDLFIEDRIYSRYEDFRPIQFLSLMNLLKEGVQATTNKEIVQNAPTSIISKSKILNLVNALHFKELFEVDLTSDFKPTKIELQKAKSLYEEFLEYRKDKAPGEEYELIQHWGEDLDLDGYFELVPEADHKKKTVDSVINDLINDPYGLDKQDTTNERQMKKFIQENTSEDVNMAVIMYMIDALEYFEGKPQEGIKKIAFELATVGMTGIDPQKKGYSVPSIKGSDFSGYKTLAYYYVSWALAIPELLSSLQMPFDKEYELAKKFKKM